MKDADDQQQVIATIDGRHVYARVGASLGDMAVALRAAGAPVAMLNGRLCVLTDLPRLEACVTVPAGRRPLYLNRAEVTALEFPMKRSLIPVLALLAALAGCSCAPEAAPAPEAPAAFDSDAPAFWGESDVPVSVDTDSDSDATGV